MVRLTRVAAAGGAARSHRTEKWPHATRNATHQRVGIEMSLLALQEAGNHHASSLAMAAARSPHCHKGIPPSLSPMRE